MREATVVDPDELETMYQDCPNGFVYTQICKGAASKCTLWIYENNVSIIDTNNTQWSYVMVYEVR